MSRASIPILIVFTFMCSCSGPGDNTKGKKGVSDSYMPPYFLHTERLEIMTSELEQMHHYYKDCMVENNLPSIVYGVVVDDSLVFSGGFGYTNIEKEISAGPRSFFRVASMSKSFTAMAILILRDEGKLRLDDPAHCYIPELAGLEYLSRDAGEITIYNLLTMTAGFPEDNPWGDRFLDISDEELLSLVEEGISFSTVTPLNYEYSNLGFGLLGQIIRNVSGLPFQDYITENILKPLDMHESIWEYSMADPQKLAIGYRQLEGDWVKVPMLHDGAFGAMGGLITSVQDFGKYISYHLSAWPPRNEEEKGPLKRSSLREMHRMNNPRFYKDPARFGDTSEALMRGYAYGLVSMKDAAGFLETGHNGGLPGFGSSYVFYPHLGLGIMAFSNLTYVGSTVRSANYRVIGELLEKGLFEARTLPVSSILARRKEEVLDLIQNWDSGQEKKIVAGNLYQDISRARRKKDAEYCLGEIGTIQEIGEMEPENQLRGSFLIKGSRKDLRVYFTLTPHMDPKVQWLSLELREKGK